jgi:hypothetical protein
MRVGIESCPGYQWTAIGQASREGGYKVLLRTQAIIRCAGSSVNSGVSQSGVSRVTQSRRSFSSTRPRVTTGRAALGCGSPKTGTAPGSLNRNASSGDTAGYLRDEFAAGVKESQLEGTFVRIAALSDSKRLTQVDGSQEVST